jgi:hypothetical protein
LDYSTDIAINFWYEFDNIFNPLYNKPDSEARKAWNKVFGEEDLINRWRRHRLSGTYPKKYIDELSSLSNEIKYLADQQLSVLENRFHGDLNIELKAFEDFGQGILYDNNREHKRFHGDRIHKMDTGWPQPPIGYHRWHAFIRAAELMNLGSQDRWLQIDRYVGLAWVIQCKQIPKDSDHSTDEDPKNPRIESDLLTRLEEIWLQKSFEELDNAFDSYVAFPFPPVQKDD